MFHYYYTFSNFLGGFLISSSVGLTIVQKVLLILVNVKVSKGFLNTGLGWTSWKKRWFILTRTSLVFFRSDPVSFHLYIYILMKSTASFYFCVFHKAVEEEGLKGCFCFTERSPTERR